VNEQGSIPFLDLVTLHRELEQELIDVFKRALDTASFVGGPMVDRFEHAFADFCGTKHCAAVSSGTDALRFALMAVGVKTGDIVITVPNTFIATVEAISQAGAEPRFVDIDEHTYNIDPTKVREYLENFCTFDKQLGVVIDRKAGKPVTAIVPVHLYGQMADMDSLLELAEQYKLEVVEDACQAHGAQYFSKKQNRWVTAGAVGRAAAFSFYPGKNLGACGEGGAVTTTDEAVAKKVRMLRDHGQASKYFHDMEGYNGRLDSIQAGILSVKLKALPGWNESRRVRARLYNELFSAAKPELITPCEPTWSKAVYHLYVVQVDNRDAIQAALAKENIGTGIHYPIPLHLQKAYASLGYRPRSFPVSEKVAKRILSLPMFPSISETAQARVAEATIRCLQENAVPRAVVTAD
jgi:dTDP-4-amino-4,6-dideoxygalactose transaminase